jgi:hypothetical protein
MAEASEKQLSVTERERALLAWLRLKYGEGMTALRKERAFDLLPLAVQYVEGKQYAPGGKALSKITDNRLRKLALETAATMTDVRPIWNYETYADEFQKQGDVLNQLARAWWRNNKADKRLVSILLYALCGGTGYGLLTYNAELAAGQGDLELIPFDPRDVVPIDATYTDSIQDWRGVMLRQRLPLETVKRMFPSKANFLEGKETSWGPLEMRAGGSGAQSFLISPQWDILDGRKGGPQQAGVDVMRAYMKDDSLNLTDNPITLGEGDWAYTVYPMGATKPDGTLATRQDARLYPRGRLVIFTPETVLKDIPNPHWHGKFPVIRFTLDPLPWSLLGSSTIGDLIPLQDSLNEALRGADDGLQQWVRRSVAADKRSMPKSALDALDTRKSGVKMSYNPAAGEPFKLLDGPAPQVFKIYAEHIQFLKQEMEDTGGLAGVAALSQMGQMPSADTMERYMEALSPILRLRARNMELALAELAEFLKVGFFQWYSAPRRIELLGKDGLTREDFDYDPGTMVPAGEKRPDGSTPPRMELAMEHHKLFSFQVAPNSWLNVSHAQQKMFYLQLFRANMLDPWTIWDQFDIPDAGPMPAETVPERIVEARKQGLVPGPTPEIVQTQLALQLAQLQQQLMMIQQQQQQMQMGGPPQAAPPGPGGPPQGGPKVPGPTSQGGRPPSGQTPPHFEVRDGGTRPIVAES